MNIHANPLQQHHQVAIDHHIDQLAAIENARNPYGKFLREHGHYWRAARRPTFIKQGPPKSCFATCQKLAMSRSAGKYGLAYVEGFAVSAKLAITLPIHHAWLIDKNGVVTDPVWDDCEQSTYFGVAFTTDYVRATVRRTQAHDSLIDNYKDRWSLLDPALNLDDILHERNKARGQPVAPSFR